MRTRAKVVATVGEYATVLCDRKSACEGCHKQTQGECSVCSLMASGHTMQTRAYNAVGAKVGDTVEIETASSRVLGYAALVFLLPVVMVILGYVLAGYVTDVDAWRFATAILLAALTFGGVRIYSEHVRKKQVDVTVVAVVEPQSSEQQGLE